MYGEPVNNSHFYIKFYTDKDYNNSERPLAVLSEGHIGFQGDKNGNGFRTTFFTRESQHYWLDGSMLGIVNTGSVNNDGNGQGVRFDIWNPYTLEHGKMPGLLKHERDMFTNFLVDYADTFREKYPNRLRMRRNH